MVRWTEENKQQLLLAIIEHLNPTSLPWEKLSNAMGPDFSTEAVRQQYKTIKKGFKTTTTASDPQSVAKFKDSIIAKAKKAIAAPTTKGRKRKAAEISNEDDEEDAFTAPGSPKIKTEFNGTGFTAEVFKVEPVGEEAVDLENDASIPPPDLHQRALDTTLAG